MWEKMIFISWSEKGSASHRLAEFLGRWLPRVLKGVKPYVSSVDIAAGEPWLANILNALRQSTFAILCLSRKNMQSPWIHFEAGATARSFNRRLVCPLLIDMSPSELRYPLSIFQAVQTTRKDLRRLLMSLNGRLCHPMNRTQLESVFDKRWPELSAFLAHLQGGQHNGFWHVLTQGMKPDEQIRIVLSAKWGVDYENGKPTRKPGHTVQVSYNEVVTFFRFQHVLDETGHSVELVYGGIHDFAANRVTAPDFPDDGTLLILGSKHANDICRRILSSDRLADIPFRYEMTSKSGKCIHVYQDDSGKYHKKPIASFPPVPLRGRCGSKRRDSALDVDYGIILRATNPLDRTGSRKVLILGGNHGFGTESAIQFITDLANCSALNDAVGGHDFELLFDASVGRNRGLKLGILRLGLLEDGKWLPLNSKQLHTLRNKCRG
jgi:hypothetical protein